MTSSESIIISAMALLLGWLLREVLRLRRAMRDVYRYRAELHTCLLNWYDVLNRLNQTELLKDVRK